MKGLGLGVFVWANGDVVWLVLGGRWRVVESEGIGGGGACRRL